MQQPQGDLARAMADPMLPVAEADNKNTPKVLRQQMLNEFVHLFGQDGSMLTLSTVFFILINIAVSPFYMLIFFAPRRAMTKQVLKSVWPLVLPALVHVVFIVTIMASSRPDIIGIWRELYIEHGMFGSTTVEFLSQLYGTYPEFAILHGWVHIVVGDMFMTRWAYLDALSRHIPSRTISFVALLIALTGPLGIIGYFVLRPFFTRLDSFEGALQFRRRDW